MLLAIKGVGLIHKLTIILVLCVCGLVSATYAYIGTASLHDPTSPPNTTSLNTHKGNFQINAIFTNKDPTKNSVVIDGRTLVVGDKIAGATILTIMQNEVRLKDNHGEFTISMPYLAIKTPITKTNDKKNRAPTKQ